MTEQTNRPDNDTEGHGISATKADAETAEGEEDSEGHRYFSDRNIKEKVQPVGWESDTATADEDTEGHIGKR